MQAKKAQDTKKSDKKQPNKERKKTTSPDFGNDSNADSKKDVKKANLVTKDDKQPSEKPLTLAKNQQLTIKL